jgi:hypothetical protein
LLLPQILPVFSVVAPSQPGAALRDLVLVPRGRATRERLRTLIGLSTLFALATMGGGAGARAAGVFQEPLIVGSWWQSGWKLCKPAAQLSAADVDVPIDELVIRADGTFSVTWRGGGAHTGDIPHVFIPDYTGHYTIESAAGRIRMRIDNGLFVPRDFSGSGTYIVKGSELTLTGVWFGTRQAPQRPDICELTFTRK